MAWVFLDRSKGHLPIDFPDNMPAADGAGR
jgi:hypothetical protein